MRATTWLFVCAAIIAPALVQAQGLPVDTLTQQHLDWRGHEALADTTSTVMVGAAIGLRCAFNRTATCLKTEAAQISLAVGLAEATKRLVHRTRPDGSDNKSFFSEHTELACVLTAQTKWWAICPAVGLGRMVANKHWLSDVGTGAMVGAVLTTVQW